MGCGISKLEDQDDDELGHNRKTNRLRRVEPRSHRDHDTPSAVGNRCYNNLPDADADADADAEPFPRFIPSSRSPLLDKDADSAILATATGDARGRASVAVETLSRNPRANDPPPTRRSVGNITRLMDDRNSAKPLLDPSEGKRATGVTDSPNGYVGRTGAWTQSAPSVTVRDGPGLTSGPDAEPEYGAPGRKGEAVDGLDKGSVVEGKDEEEAGEWDRERLLWPASPSFREYCVDYGSSDSSDGGDGTGGSVGKKGAMEEETEEDSLAPLAPHKDSEKQSDKNKGRRRQGIKGVLSKRRPMGVKKLWSAAPRFPPTRPPNPQRLASEPT